MTIALRRGSDWVLTGLYDSTAKRPDGSDRFNSASDFVVKYTLKNIDGSSAIYKNPVRLLSGTTNTYCVQHDDGTIYVLDGYDPIAKTYYADVVDSVATDINQQYSVLPIWKSKTNNRSIQRFAYNDLIRHDRYPEFLIRPIGYTNTGYATTRVDYYPDPVTKAATPFTFWYFDDNGVEIEYGGNPALMYTTYNDISTLQTWAAQQESHAYHSLFFAGEKATFINAAVTGTDMGTYGNKTDATLNAVFQSGTTLERNTYFATADSFPIGDPGNYTLNIQPTTPEYPGGRLIHVKISNSKRSYIDSNGHFICIEASDGMYFNSSSGKRCDVITLPKPYSSLNNLLTPSPLALAQMPAAVSAGLTKIDIPTIQATTTAVSFANIPTPTLSTTNVLQKNVDYILGSICPTGEFLTDIIVKCRINGTVGKYSVNLAPGTPASYYVKYIDPATSQQTLYKLADFDPYERYYSFVDAQYGMGYTTDWPTVGYNWDSNPAHNYSIANLNYLRTGHRAHNIRGKFRPMNAEYQYYVGKQLWPTSGSTAPAASRLASPIAEDKRFKYTYMYNGTKLEFAVAAFSKDVNAIPVEFAGTQFLLDPVAVASGRIIPKNMYYHKFFFEGEKAGFYDVTPDTVSDVFLNGPYPTSAQRLYSKIDGYFQIRNGGAGDNISIWSDRFTDANGQQVYKQYNNGRLFCSLDMEIRGIYSQFGNVVGIFGGSTYTMHEKCIVPSPHGLYVDYDGNRYDYLKLVSHAGYYIPIESVTNQMTVDQLMTETDNILRGRLLDTIPKLDQAAMSIVQLAQTQQQVTQLQAQQTQVQTDKAAAFAAQQAANNALTTQTTQNATALAAVQAQLATATQNYTQASATITNLQQQLTQLQAQQTQAQADEATALAAQQTANDAVTAQTTQNTTALAAVQSQLDIATQNYTQASATVTNLQQQITQLQAQQTQAQADEATALAAQQTATDALSEAQATQDEATITAAQAQLDTATQNYTQIVATTAALQQQIVQLQAQQTQAQADEAAALAAQQTANDAVTAQTTQNTTALAAAQAQLDTATQNYTQASTTVTNLQQQLTQLQAQQTQAQADEATALAAKQAAENAVTAKTTQNEASLAAAQTQLDTATQNYTQLIATLNDLQQQLIQGQLSLATQLQQQLTQSQQNLTQSQQQATQLQQQLVQAQADKVAALAAQKAASDAVLAAQKSQDAAALAAAQAQLATATQNYTQAAATVTNLQQQLIQAQQSLTQSQQQLTQTQQQLTQAQQNLTQSQQQLVQAQQQLTQVQQSLTQTQQQLVLSQQNLSQTQQQAAQLQQQLTQAQADKATALAAQKTASDAVLAAQKSQDGSSIAAAQAQVATATQNYTQSASRVVELQQELSQVQQNLATQITNYQQSTARVAELQQQLTQSQQNLATATQNYEQSAAKVNELAALINSPETLDIVVEGRKISASWTQIKNVLIFLGLIAFGIFAWSNKNMYTVNASSRY